ncbi:GntR family transcriptional regulator [Bordetella tumulicola]|uniref:GntR family transcriptional regulator n=1 Tax=Bordetella tumulicola TaxID=1649133 RepID=UPI0039EF33BA
MDLDLSREPSAPASSSMQDRIRLSLEKEILSGKRPPGSAIDEKALAARFQASRTPVREALLVLATQGLISIVPRSGIFVRRATAGELIATLETLCELEAALARLAARRATPTQHRELKAALAKASDRAVAADRPGYQKANAVLHEAIYRASGNSVLVEHVRNVRRALAAYRQRGFDQPGRLAASNAEHREIVAAICAGNQTRVDEAMRRHINVGGDAMTALVMAAEAGAVASTSGGARRQKKPAY